MQSLLAGAARRFAAAGIDSPRHDAELLMCHVLDSPRTSLHGTAALSEQQAERFAQVVDRRCRREPVQHITGIAHFRYLELRVGPGVFVPRPETELLASAAIAELRDLTASGNTPVLAVDLCSGSGAVAAAMASEVSGTAVTAVELSPQAYRYAVANTTGHHVDVRLGDIADTVDDLGGQVHVVTANPPYIPLAEFESVALEARDYDPPTALWAGEDGLDVIRVVESVAARLLVPGGLVVCEHADTQGAAAPQVFAGSGRWVRVKDNPDLAGRPRFVSARRSTPQVSGLAP